ncbi:MAG: NAD/NADP octopine/nopaline dehydrogenase family protein [Ardenticatenaceae bacterium]|nr:NAD/NADP octopine/nopaline dehydrogenase family protein [Ardenticatenaceae bacterium]
MATIERVAVLGAGPGGMAAAVALARRGYDVTLFNRSEERIATAQERGGVEIEGDLGEDFVPLSAITTDPETALHDRQLVLIAVPAYGQVPLAKIALPSLRPDSIVLLLTGSCGSLEVALLFREAGLDLNRTVLLGETVTLPQSARMVGPARLRIKLPSNIRSAAFPGRRTDELIERIGDTLRLLPKPNVLDPGLNNPNFLIHPAPMLLNYAAVERADGYLSIMNEGMTDGVLRCLDAVDAEKMALCRAVGLEAITIDDLYRETGSGPHVYRKKGEPFGLRDRIWPRYINEDVPYGTVLMSSLGDLIGVPTPVCDSINHILSVVEQVDFWSTGRTVEKMGLAGMTVEQVKHYLQTGDQPEGWS